MPREKIARPKYIAEGFHIDAGKLLDAFVKKTTTEFSEFAAIWRDLHFSLVFMGRPDHIENTEFTNEIFKVSLHFLATGSFYKQVGSIYLLYALFRNQISVPPIKIRLEIRHWNIVKTLHVEASLKKYRTLHYVIDYLIQNAFIFVALQLLRGPLTSLQSFPKNFEKISNLKASYKSDIVEYRTSNNLETLRDLHRQYLEEKKNFADEVKVQLDTYSNSYEKFINELKEIVEPPTFKEKRAEYLGTRRAKLKALAFARKTQNRFGNETAEEQSKSESEANKSKKAEAKKKSPAKKKKKKNPQCKYVPKDKRRLGRPSRKRKSQKEPEPESDDDNIDISHLLSQQKEFYLPPTGEVQPKKGRTRRDHYYKVSPKREDSSDPECDP